MLREAGVGAEVLVRPRHFVSVHRVRLKRGEVTGADLGRLLVLVAEDADCYAVLGELHTCFTPFISEFKDFIAAPKFNLYQSLHTAVAGEYGEVAEVIVRTHQMHRVAEAGVIALGTPSAAEPPDDACEERSDPTRPGWLSRLLEWQRAAPDPDTFWTSLHDELAQDREITVFRADGGTVGLPAGSSCVDAAYAQYGQGGHSCIGARVNGRLVTLSTVLRDGGHPAPADVPGHRLRAVPRLAGARPYARGADRHRPLVRHPPGGRARRFPGGGPAPRRRGPRRGRRAPASRTPVAVVCDEEGFAAAHARLAGCCTPVPPDEVTGFAVRGRAVTVHRAECPVVARMVTAGRRPVRVHWRDPAGPGSGDCRVTLRAESFSRPHLLADLTEVIAAQGAAVISAAVEPPHEQRVRHTYTLQLPDAAHLPELMRAMRRVPGVYDVGRAGRPAAASL
ncbi:hypothetical protein GCM10020221_32720 [Streptomyces thioluteus]|uniref:ACT domain-containing protein n=1 Tax=Streptomyces thioluteus TaxID=66431 RepID=A0ABN3X3R6_STRTU